MRKSVLLSVLWVGSLCCLAGATPVIDAEYAPAATNTYWVFGNLARAQTFTVGASGVLSRFEVLLSTSDAASRTRLFEIHPTVGGVPVLGSAPLASAIISYGASAGEHFYGADISSFDIQVSPGDVLAVVDPGSGANTGWWAGRFTAPFYLGGQLYTQYYTDRLLTVPSTDYRSEPGYDLGFRTYVDAGGDLPLVPAPGAALLAGLGVLCAAIRRRL